MANPEEAAVPQLWAKHVASHRPEQWPAEAHEDVVHTAPFSNPRPHKLQSKEGMISDQAVAGRESLRASGERALRSGRGSAWAGLRGRGSTHVDEVVAVADQQVAQNAGLVEVSQADHVLHTVD